MRSLTARFRGADSVSRSSDRRELTLGMLFTLSLIVAITIWDAMALRLDPVTWAGCAVIAVSVGSCVLLLSRSRRRWPLLFCAVALISIRLASAFLRSAPAYDVRFPADCLMVCISLSAIAFRQEMAPLSRRIREAFRPRRVRPIFVTAPRTIAAEPDTATAAGD
jgi:hypothetical protein